MGQIERRGEERRRRGEEERRRWGRGGEDAKKRRRRGEWFKAAVMEKVLSCPGPYSGSHVAASCRSQDEGFGSLDRARWDGMGTHSLRLYQPRYPAGNTNTHPHTQFIYCEHTIPYCGYQTEAFHLQSVITWKWICAVTVLTFWNTLTVPLCLWNIYNRKGVAIIPNIYNIQTK